MERGGGKYGGRVQTNFNTLISSIIWFSNDITEGVRVKMNFPFGTEKSTESATGFQIMKVFFFWVRVCERQNVLPSL